jgi:putative ubiquitin-RnfH superfamily antitoxin RatB of RatAB toxin-antitoxin module
MAVDDSAALIWVEVVYALPARQELLRLEVPLGATVAEAIEISGIQKKFDDLEIGPGAVGIFSRKVPMDQVLREGDRVEIYRPLIADPKEARRRRADGKKPA